MRQRVAMAVAGLGRVEERDALDWVEAVSEFDAPGAPHHDVSPTIR